MRLILFDIDGTLITARGAGRRALRPRAPGRLRHDRGQPRHATRCPGKTRTRGIVYDVMAAGGVDRRALVRGAARRTDFRGRTRRAWPRRSATGAACARCPASPSWCGGFRMPPTASSSGSSPATSSRAPASSSAPTGLLPLLPSSAPTAPTTPTAGMLPPSLAARRAHALPRPPVPRPTRCWCSATRRHDVDCARALRRRRGGRRHAPASLGAPASQLERPDLLFDNFADVEHAARTLLSHP